MSEEKGMSAITEMSQHHSLSHVRAHTHTNQAISLAEIQVRLHTLLLNAFAP